MKRVTIGLLLALVSCIIFLTANSSAAPEKDKEKKKDQPAGIPYQDYILNDININNPNVSPNSTAKALTPLPDLSVCLSSTFRPAFSAPFSSSQRYSSCPSMVL
jgi:hypothetical protein